MSALEQDKAPANVDAERAILGGILLDPHAYEQATERLRAQDFVLDSHRRIFGRMEDLAKAGSAIDTITLLEELSRRGETEAIGGVAYITSLTDGLPRRPSIHQYVKIVRDYAGKRLAANAAAAIEAQAIDGASLSELASRFADTSRQLGEYDPASVTRITALDQIPDPFTLRSDGTRWLVDCLIPRGEVVVLAGEPGIGKTYFALALARAVSFGAPFLGRNSEATNVVYLDRENPLGVIVDRLQILIGGPGVLRPWGMWCEDEPPLIGDPRLLDFAKDGPLIVFDSFIRFHSAENENDAAEMSSVMGNLRALANAGASVLVLHHRGKSETSLYRGSSDIGAGADVVLALAKREELLELRTVKTRHADVTITLRPDFAAGEFEPTDSPVLVQRRDDVAQMVKTIAANVGASSNRIVKESKMGRTKALRLLRERDGNAWESRELRGSVCWFPKGDTGTELVSGTTGTGGESGTPVPAPLRAVPSTTPIHGNRDSETQKAGRRCSMTSALGKNTTEIGRLSQARQPGGEGCRWQ
jgi:hypothetical protein